MTRQVSHWKINEKKKREAKINVSECAHQVGWENKRQRTCGFEKYANNRLTKQHIINE